MRNVMSGMSSQRYNNTHKISRVDVYPYPVRDILKDDM